MKLDLSEAPRRHWPAPQCVTCNRFVKVDDPATRRIDEMGDYGTVLSTEFECGRCAKGRRP